MYLNLAALPSQEESPRVASAQRRPLRLRQKESPVAQRVRQGLLLHAHRPGRKADSNQVHYLIGKPVLVRLQLR